MPLGLYLLFILFSFFGKAIHVTGNEKKKDPFLV